jgi:hypothetical protein
MKNKVAGGRGGGWALFRSLPPLSTAGLKTTWTVFSPPRILASWVSTWIERIIVPVWCVGNVGWIRLDLHVITGSIMGQLPKGDSILWRYIKPVSNVYLILILYHNKKSYLTTWSSATGPSLGGTFWSRTKPNRSRSFSQDSKAKEDR